MAFQTSASELANYKGDAAAAIGSSDNVGANIVFGNTDTARLNERLDLVATANLAKNKAIYDQKIKDRDDLFAKIKGGDLAINQMTENDRSSVREKYLKPMRDMMIANPDLKSNPDQYVKYMQLSQDFEEAKVYGNHRYVMLTDLDKNIAAETDPQTKKRMQEHRDQQASQELFKEMKPFQKQLDFDDKTFVSVEAVPGGPITTTKGDMIYKTTKSATPLAKFQEGVLFNYVDSPTKTIHDQMDLYKNQMDALSDDQKKTQLEMWNQKIDEVNLAEGLTRKDPGYIKRILYSTEKGPDGKDHVIINATTPEVILAASLLKNYKNSSNTTSELSPLASTIEKNRQAALKDAAEIKITIPANAAAKYADIAKSRAETQKALAETTKIKGEGGKEQQSGEYWVTSLQNMTDFNQFKNLKDAEKQDQFKEIRDKNGKITQVGATGKVLIGKDDAGNVASALSPQETRALGRPFNTASGQIVVQTPDAAVLSGTKKNPYYITYYDTPAKEAGFDAVKGVATPATPASREAVIVYPQQLLDRLVKGTVGENSTGKENEVILNANEAYKRMSGNDDINTGIGTLNETRNTRRNGPPPAAATLVPQVKGATSLSVPEETKFQAWAAKNAMTSNDYDARGLYKSLKGEDPGEGHKTDKYKFPNHITFSEESQYSNAKTKGGKWSKTKDGSWAYTPSAYVLSQHTEKELKDYFEKEEPDAELILPPKVPAPPKVKSKIDSIFNANGKKN